MKFRVTHDGEALHAAAHRAHRDRHDRPAVPLDSIPAIFGITESAFIVFTANVFALMGLRQLYFLLGGLLERLVYLKYGIALILAFIGVKLVLHALHENELRS